MRYITPKDAGDGWTVWVAPRMDKYKMRCCDCGLVHEMQFRVVEDDKDDPLVDTEKVIDGLPIFRVRRDERATAAIRRKRTK